VYSEENFLYYAVQNDNGMDFGAVARVELEGGKPLSVKNGSLQISQANRVLIFIQLFTDASKTSAGRKLSTELEWYCFCDYSALLERHAHEHSSVISSDEV